MEIIETEVEKTPMRKSPIPDKDGLHRRRRIWHYKLRIDGKWREYSTGTRVYAEAKRKRQEALQNQAEGKLENDRSRLVFEKALALYLTDRKKRGLSLSTLRVDRERSAPLSVFFTDRKSVV